MLQFKVLQLRPRTVNLEPRTWSRLGPAENENPSSPPGEKGLAAVPFLIFPRRTPWPFLERCTAGAGVSTPPEAGLPWLRRASPSATLDEKSHGCTRLILACQPEIRPIRSRFAAVPTPAGPPGSPPWEHPETFGA